MHRLVLVDFFFFSVITALDKKGYLVNICLHKNICCGYSLEVPSYE